MWEIEYNGIPWRLSQEKERSLRACGWDSDSQRPASVRNRKYHNFHSLRMAREKCARYAWSLRGSRLALIFKKYYRIWTLIGLIWMQMIFSLLAKHLLVFNLGKELEKMKQDFNLMSKGFFSLSLNVPGTNFHKSLHVIINVFLQNLHGNNKYTVFVFD